MTLQDLIVALIFSVLGTALFLIVTHPSFWKRSPAARTDSPARNVEQKVEAPSVGAAYQAGRDLTIHPSAMPPTDFFADAPHIWSNVRASPPNIGCEVCGVIGLHFHSWQAEMGTLPRVEAKVETTIVEAPSEEKP